MTCIIDLYGDDNEYAVSTEQESHAKTEEEDSSAAKTAASTAVTEPSKHESPPPKVEQKPTPIPTLSNGDAPQPIQSYSSTPQDYSTRRTDDYHSNTSNDAVQPISSALPAAIGHVRPSEMKEEG